MRSNSNVGLRAAPTWIECNYRYDPPFKFTGQISKLTFKLEPQPIAAPETETKAAPETKSEMGPLPAPEPIEGPER